MRENGTNKERERVMRGKKRKGEEDDAKWRMHTFNSSE